MSARYWPAVLAGVLTLEILCSSAAVSGELLRMLRACHCEQGTTFLANPAGFVAVPPVPSRFGGCGSAPAWSGYGFGIPTYNWGYFGARYRPACVSHTGYYGDYVQWGYRRGY